MKETDRFTFFKFFMFQLYNKYLIYFEKLVNFQLHNSSKIS